MHRLQELVRLHRMGTSGREVARLLGMGRNTEREYREAIEAAGLLDGEAEKLPELETLKMAVEQHLPRRTAPQQVSSIESWRGEVEQMMDKGAGPRAI